MARTPGGARAELVGYIDRDQACRILPRKSWMTDTSCSSGAGTSLDPPRRRRGAGGWLSDALMRSPLYRRVVDHPNVRRYAALIERQASASALEPALVKAVIAVESGFEPAAVSPKGALGLMQSAAGTPASVTGHRRSPKHRRAEAVGSRPPMCESAPVTCTICSKMFDHDLTLALAAYNAGEEAVRQAAIACRRIAETRDYVALVRQFEALYQPPQVAPAATAARPRARSAGRKGYGSAFALTDAPTGFGRRIRRAWLSYNV